MTQTSTPAHLEGPSRVSPTPKLENLSVRAFSLDRAHDLFGGDRGNLRIHFERDRDVGADDAAQMLNDLLDISPR
ncbi:MAG: hypothetical protein GEU73_04070 [Chloroflexi bacterium]|nr:hypothetical protein [Chloroflexota bacterium]